MRLISIDQITKTAIPNYLDVLVTWQVEEGNQFYTPGLRQDLYTWYPQDTSEFGLQITTYMNNNSGITIQDYITPLSVEPDQTQVSNAVLAKVISFLKQNPDVVQAIGSQLD